MLRMILLSATLLFSLPARALVVQYDSHNFQADWDSPYQELPWIDHMRVVVDWDKGLITDFQLVSDWISAEIIEPRSFENNGSILHGETGWSVTLGSGVHIRLTEHETGRVYNAGVFLDWHSASMPTLEEALAGHTHAILVDWEVQIFEARPTGTIKILDAFPVPEPSTLALFSLGLAAFAFRRRKS